MEKLTIKRLAEIQAMELEPGAQEIVSELAAEVVRLKGVIQGEIARADSIKLLSRKIGSIGRKALGD